MKLITQKVDVEKRVVNANQGHTHCYFTEKEYNDFCTGKMNGRVHSMERDVYFHNHVTEIRMDRTYVEGKLGLRQLIRIIHKLSKDDRGALSKQIYPYYEKVGVSAMKRDLMKLYKDVNYIDISNPANRQNHFSTLSIYIGKKEYYAGGDGLEALEDITKDHLKRCIAILAEKGYITISNSKQNKRMKGYGYTYSFTYYKLTAKAEKVLQAQ